MKKNFHWLVIAISVFMIISLSRSVVDLWERQNIVKQEEKRLQEVEKKHNELTKTFQMVQTNAFVEKEARERLGMAKAEDTVIIMDTAQVSQENNNGGKREELESAPNWKLWWQMFF
jgi:cell division protein FtsB